MSEQEDSINKENDSILSPSEFYRRLRPENFSDSEISTSHELPKEVLAFELDNITKNQKENQFETLARKLAEKLITPNLIPQVGPTGGGDGKTDSETYPVSTSISDRWFIPNNGWDKDEKWAFAISAKKTWKSKLKSDIVSILGTERDYTRIYFITNQTPSSKKKKDAQDEFIKQFKINIVILDGVWILENVYSSNLINLVVDSLNLSEIYRRDEKYLGSNDIRREKKLAEIEENISNPNRYFEYDFQLVEDALEAAILTKKLEKPRTELEGKFDRVERLVEKTGNKGQILRFRYQKAWTYVNYYDDYKAFLIEYHEFKKHIHSYITISSIEYYTTLYTLLRTVQSNNEKLVPLKLLKSEKKELFDFLEKISKRKTSSSTSLTALMYKDITLSFDLIDKPEENRLIFLRMKKTILASEGRLEFPFEQFQKMILILGNIFTNSNEFDDLFETVIRLSETRTSQMEAGQLYINRGGQKMANKNYRDGLINFGKAITRLSKSESQYGFYLASMGLSQAYGQLGLHHASYASKVSAVSILLKPWFDEGNLDSRLIDLVDNLLGEEILLGKLPHFLTWHELFRVLYYQLKNADKIDGIDNLTKFDTFLCVRLLNSSLDEDTLEHLPLICKKQELLLSEDVALFLLGYQGDIFKDYLHVNVKSEKELEDYYNVVANQPLRNQFINEIECFSNKNTSLSTTILGCEIEVQFNTETPIIILAETILAYIEGFLGTSLDNLYPSCERILIKLQHSSNEYKVVADKKTHCYNLYWDANFNPANDQDRIFKCGMDLMSLILINDFIMEDYKIYLEDLFKAQEVNERLQILLNHKIFIGNVLGDKPKLTFDNWKSEITPNVRESRFVLNKSKSNNIDKKIISTKSKHNKSDLQSIPHNKRKVISIIENKLWDNASWKGMGVFGSPDGVGLILGFENIEFGVKIFEDWIDRFGNIDANDKIKISIITDIDNKNPFWYQVMISSNFQKNEIDEDTILLTPCRYHQMNAVNNRNLLVLKEGIKRFKKLRLYCGKIEEDLQMQVNFDLWIEKTEIVFVHKNDVKENDIEYVAVMNS